MIEIQRPEKVITVTNRYGYIYNVIRGSLRVDGDVLVFESRNRAVPQHTRVSILLDEVASVAEVVA